MAPQVAVISGTARMHGIGRACARVFVRAGVLVLGVDSAPAEQLPGELESFRAGYRHHIADISSAAEVAGIPQALSQLFGQEVRVTTLVNNAGIAGPHLPQQGTPEEIVGCWNRVIAVNLTGAFLMTQALLPLLGPGASIIHISSTRALQSEHHSEAYAAAKAGLLGLTHAQAASLAGRARVNAVLPGWIDTSGDPAGIRPEDHQWHFAGRVGVPEDVAEMCLFLADSSKSGFITGQQLVVDGGVTRKMVYPE